MNTSYADAVAAGQRFAEMARAAGEGAPATAARFTLERTLTERASDAGGTRERAVTERVTAEVAAPAAAPFRLPAAPASGGSSFAAPLFAAAEPPPLYERREQALRLAIAGRAAEARAVDARALAESAGAPLGAPLGDPLRAALAERGLLSARDLLGLYGYGPYGYDPYGYY